MVEVVMMLAWLVPKDCSKNQLTTAYMTRTRFFSLVSWPVYTELPMSVGE